MGRAEQVGKSFLQEAAEANDKHVRDTLWKHGKYTLSLPGLRSMGTPARKRSTIKVAAEDFDANPHLFNCWNGTLDMSNGELREHRREDLITKLAPVMFDPTAKASTWNKFIRRVLPDDEVRRYVQRAVGQR